MARARKAKPKEPSKRRALWRRALGWVGRGVLLVLALAIAWVFAYRFVTPPTWAYIYQEERRLSQVLHVWVPMEQINPHMPRALIAAEDANFCLHWGFDMTEIRRVIEQGESRGASTITQQVAKNIFLWHGRTITRKALESGFTLLIEVMWPKRRILEVYLNMAEFDEGIFGVEAAAKHYFRTTAADLTPLQAARLAAVLPAPKSRDAANPTQFLRERSRAILDGAATIAQDGRDGCIGG
jgi:monofunctional biosynthetic peptidoglycan transglycosylase